ncbi:methyltransferase [Neptuniibacter sp.]|uniref:methyltransferase n=1 Tax=Neptuniibacter sp. TaxID=1962643 RepID=UPI0026086846|nr:methyltransferase [Neptuniibacter sp.]MCP4597497.1 methyltransferase [Neptuniibacter sp.]
METLVVPQGQFSLSRYPKRKREQLRAWDAADEYILQQIDEEQLLKNDCKVLVLNDQFGALSVALNKYNPIMISDSWLAHAGTRSNADDNSIEAENISIRNSLDYPDESFDLILLKVPKSLAMLEDQLIRLRPLLHSGSKLIAGGMAKGIHTSTLKLFEKIIGPTKTSLAKKKARLIFPEFDPAIGEKASPFPSEYILEGTQHKIINHAGVFSRDSLDIGTRFFLQHLPDSDKFQNIVDLGCGNGIVGLIAAEKNPSAQLQFVDESFMAVASASANFKTAFGDEREAAFLATDCLKGIKKSSCDLILNNPPFHQQNVVGDFIALQMFRESKEVLLPGGELWVIGNRHLGYHSRLKKLFGNCETVASNKKFVILKAVK